MFADVPPEEPEREPWYLAIPPETPDEQAWRQDVLARAKPLPPPIEDLTAEESEAFLIAIAELRSDH